MATNSSNDFSFGKLEGDGNEIENIPMIHQEKQKSLEEKPAQKEKPLSTASLSSMQIEESQMSDAVVITAAGPARFLQDDKVIAQMSDDLICKLQSTTKIDDSTVQKSEPSGKS